MKERWIAAAVTSAVSVVLLATLEAGGWVGVAVRDFPEYAVAGTPLRLTFMIRGHGVVPLDGLHPWVTATSGKRTIKALAVATKKTGEYTAAVTPPAPGEWTLDIYDFAKMPTLTVIAPGSQAPPPLTSSARGQRLFVSKSCAGCHENRDVPNADSVGIGPDLTGTRFPDAYLRTLLADPKKALRRGSDSEYGDMPNLELRETEIADLAAFINRER